MSKHALRALGSWFERRSRILPWRENPSLYRVWVSEIMLQQTQVATVIPYFERFLARFPTVESLAEAAEDEVLLQWAGLGYYSRARNLHRAAREIVARGGFPRTRGEWLELPGIGPYTAGAIASIALNQPEPILDGNVERVVSRWYQVDRAGGDAAFKARLWELSGKLVREGSKLGVEPRVFNQALMELGATVCSPRSPKCPLCPIAANCQARAAGVPEAYPPPKAPKKWIEVREEAHCVFDSQGRVLVEKRAAGKWRAGLWDLPESPPSRGAARELGQVETKHVVTRHKVTRVTRVWSLEREWKASESAGAWIAPSEPEVAVGSAFKRTLKTVLESFPLGSFPAVSRGN